MKAKRKKEPKPMDLPNPLQVSEKAFTDVIDRMIATEPVPLKNMERRKNPETDPRYLPVFPAMENIKKK